MQFLKELMVDSIDLFCFLLNSRITFCIMECIRVLVVVISLEEKVLIVFVSVLVLPIVSSGFTTVRLV